MKKVSVIIPVYNGEKFISDAVRSVLNQTYENIEIVVIDDCSTDRTRDILFGDFGKLIDKKIFYYRNKENRERVYSRNKGISLSTGEYLFFLDYDDLWDKNYIQDTIPYLKEYDIVYSFPRTFIDSSGKIIRKSNKKVSSLEKIIFSGLIGYPSASAFRKNSFPEYKEEFLMREDWEIFIRSYLKGLKIKILDNNMVFIREHSNRTSRDKRFYYATVKVFESYQSSIPDRFAGYFLFHTGEVCIRYGNLPKGWMLIQKALIKNPELIKDKRNILSVLKRGFRIDRALRFFTGN
ncbi:Glycosyltransferase involved in cell wall bisynthesis [Persephonella hydrogeniphila]|uniref:Glycosyltransferase involved in cell wall bisynthesis n=1 Tax=Persephonella hydrogeniphila TaxID=198703 RepID=A0A285N2M7_9AQUI|nr:glycosyltransferase family 2 protein [Persephonella hydrogeniphila]SNZ03689.1 Glycosyltransferase involved in cell wall bisynthesis [Persephonella hydrogeniphila]